MCFRLLTYFARYRRKTRDSLVFVVATRLSLSGERNGEGIQSGSSPTLKKKARSIHYINATNYKQGTDAARPSDSNSPDREKGYEAGRVAIVIARSRVLIARESDHSPLTLSHSHRQRLCARLRRGDELLANERTKNSERGRGTALPTFPRKKNARENMAFSDRSDGEGAPPSDSNLISARETAVTKREARLIVDRAISIGDWRRTITHDYARHSRLR